MIPAGKAPQHHPSLYKTVLIVDDDDTVASFFHTLLKEEGFATIVVHSGQEAINKLKINTPQKIDLVVLDLMMPAPGGYEVLKKCRTGTTKMSPCLW